MARLSKKGKIALFVGAGAALAVAFAGTKNAVAAQIAETPDEDEDEPQSPGWPQPAMLPSAQPGVVEMPDVPTTVQLPTTAQPTDVVLPTSVRLPTSVPEVIEMPEVETSGPAPTPTMQQSETPTRLADDTAKVLGTMLALESTSNWKRVESSLKPWQQKRGLVTDGKFGPKSAARMAQETGLLPIVRFWTAGTSPESAVPKYHDSLLAIAAKAEEPRRTQLQAAVEREQGQGFARNVTPVTPTISLG